MFIYVCRCILDWLWLTFEILRCILSQLESWSVPSHNLHASVSNAIIALRSCYSVILVPHAHYKAPWNMWRHHVPSSRLAMKPNFLSLVLFSHSSVGILWTRCFARFLWKISYRYQIYWDKIPACHDKIVVWHCLGWSCFQQILSNVIRPTGFMPRK